VADILIEFAAGEAFQCPSPAGMWLVLTFDIVGTLLLRGALATEIAMPPKFDCAMQIPGCTPPAFRTFSRHRVSPDRMEGED
jgi:hypothetical protein